MKFLKRYWMFLILFFISAFVLLAQDSTAVIKPIEIPSGFNFFYIVFFAVGMLLHYTIKVWHTIGKVNFFAKLLSNFPGWFINKFHYTALATCSVAIMALVSTYELSVSFSVLNFLGIVASIASGYIGDSAFNSGVIE